MTLSGCKHGFGFQCVKWPWPPFVMAQSDEVIVFGPWPALSLYISRSRFLSQRTGPLSGCFGIRRLPPTHLPLRQGGIQKVTLFKARNSRVVLPLAHVSFQFFLVPSLPLFSPSLPGRSFLICSLSQPFPLAAMTLKLWRHNWEDIREDVALRAERWQKAQNSLYSPPHNQSMCLCVFVAFDNYSQNRWHTPCHFNFCCEYGL